jgi:hypothetical protein
MELEGQKLNMLTSRFFQKAASKKHSSHELNSRLTRKFILKPETELKLADSTGPIL